jgi:hypothetical protein
MNASEAIVRHERERSDHSLVVARARLRNFSHRKNSLQRQTFVGEVTISCPPRQGLSVAAAPNVLRSCAYFRLQLNMASPLLFRIAHRQLTKLQWLHSLISYWDRTLS